MAHEIKSLGISSSGENNQQHHQQYGVETNDKPAPSLQQQHDLAHTSALLSNYDANYAAGMSSDSELSRNRRHHHSSAGNVNGGGHHHRPYSSQSRVYHAHPAPRTQTTSSRSSHYSDSAASTYLPNRPIQQQQLIQQKPTAIDTTKTVSAASGHLLTNQPASAPLPLTTGTPPQNLAQGSRSLLAHQASISSSGSGGSASSIAAYLGMNPMDSTILSQQQQLARLKSTGRQLPQRPFKQSMSIDHHPLMVSQQYSSAMSGPAQQSQPGPMMPQQLTADMGAMAGDGSEQQAPGAPLTDILPYQQQPSLWQPGPGSLGPQQQQQPQRQSVPAATSGGQSLSQHERFAGPATGQRNFRHDIESMDRQTANLSLYDNNSNYAGASLPPTVGRPSSTSTIRQLPAIDPNTHHHSSSALLAGSMSVDRHHPQQLPRHHQPNEAQLPPAPYSTSSNIVDAQRQRQLLTHQQMSQSSASTEWLPGTSSASGPLPMPVSHSLSRTGEDSGHPGLSQFKQATSIDHYPMRGVSANIQQQQQQPHYMPPQYPPASDPYQQHQPHGMLGYANSSPVASYDSPTRRQQQQQQQALSDHYLAYSDKQQQTNEVYYPHSRHMLPGYSSGQTSHQSSVGTPPSAGSSGPNVDQHIQHDNLGHSTHGESYPAFAGGNFKREQVYTGRGSSSEHNRPTVQHQMSSSSSNNSQSGSLNSDNRHPGEHLKPTSSAPAQHHQDTHHQYQSQQLGRSPQHKSNVQHHRSDMLRRGYTSASTAYESGAMSSGGVGTGSNTALSDIGDVSVSQSSTATHSGTMASHSLGSNNRRPVRAISPSAPFETGTASAGSHAHHHTSEGKDVSGIRSESSTGLPNGSSGASSSLTKKSNSATQLSMTGTKKRLGFRKKQVTSFSVHRSEEVAPFEARHLVKQGSSVSEGDSSMSGDSSSRSWSNSNFKQPTSDELASMSFIDGLGKGQMISRQGLASPYLGDIQLSLCDRRGNLEVEVIRARNLQAKTNKILPLTYVKLYLVKNRKCLAKAKTTLSNKRTLNPLFQQQLTFHEDYRGCILQSIVWGNFGKMDKKNFMGIAQISIDDLELSDTVISWYKLFLPSSLQTLPSKSLRHTLLSNSTESFTNSNNPQQ